MHEVDSLAEAIDWIKEHYGRRLQGSGADQVDVVDLDGEIVKRFSVG